ncbi:hypothetical protein PR048_013039 [Dryococelus australis]|uniref:Uncharacterized protein n=1 Tax=Dryococelus australis TaxID=614101 RepID=A0ABQ9HR40_9NEOP|nr:hypothetical protein PR048_013039 [Dryococelus australis]
MFIWAERVGDWDLHLFCVKSMLPVCMLQDICIMRNQIEELPSSLMPPLEYTRFVQEGAFTLKGEDMSSDPETWSDMVIEQNIIHSMKVKGGLTSGRGFSENVFTQWILSGSRSLKLCDALEKLCSISNTSSEQHVELRDSRRSTDDRDIKKFLAWFSAHPPSQMSQALHAISTGVVTDENINPLTATRLLP